MSENIFRFFNKEIADSITHNGKILIRNMEKEELLKKVQEKIYNVPNKKENEINVPNGTLIVLGYQIVQNKEDYSFSLMGKYESGELSLVYLNDSLVLEHTSSFPINDESNLPMVTMEDDYMETAEWWRTPTDEEMELYNMVYNCK